MVLKRVMSRVAAVLPEDLLEMQILVSQQDRLDQELGEGLSLMHSLTSTPENSVVCYSWRTKL